VRPSERLCERGELREVRALHVISPSERPEVQLAEFYVWFLRSFIGGRDFRGFDVLLESKVSRHHLAWLGARVPCWLRLGYLLPAISAGWRAMKSPRPEYDHVKVGQIWFHSKRLNCCWLVRMRTARMVTIRQCDAVGEQTSMFDHDLRLSTFIRDYEPLYQTTGFAAELRDGMDAIEKTYRLK
jgi:hypothetical protein